jgi:hypothetical protein
MATRVLASGAGFPDPQRLGQVEQQQPPGTRLQLRLVCRSVTVPAVSVGPLHLGGQTVASASTLAAGLAHLANQVVQAVPQLRGIPTWPGRPLATAQGGTVALGWVTDAPWSPPLIGALAGLSTTLLAVTLGDVGILPAVVLGAIVGLGVALLVGRWQLLAVLAGAAPGVVPPLLLWAAGLGAGWWLWHQVQSG